MIHFSAKATLAAASVLIAAGCSSIGPGTVARDRSDYLSALSASWKEQTLHNVVKIRYGDAPAFIDVSSIVSSYALGGEVRAGYTSNSLASAGTAQQPWNTAVVGGDVHYQDTPTISYAPLSGDRLTKRLIRPIPPVGIFELIQAGNAADIVLQITVRSLNGIRNQGTSGGEAEPADPQFYPLLDALRRLQLSGRLSVRTEKQNNEEVGVFVITEGSSPQDQQDLKFVRETLNVTPAKNGDIVITFGARPRNRGELAVLSRSMGEILIDLAMDIEVPAADIAAGRTVPTVRSSSAANPRERPMVRIHSGSAVPARAFAAIRYNYTWFWIDEDDYASKRTFTLLMIFTSLAETGVVPQVPTLTLPVR